MQSLSPNLPPDTQREMLRRMLTIRRFEERASADYLAGKIGYHQILRFQSFVWHTAGLDSHQTFFTRNAARVAKGV